MLLQNSICHRKASAVSSEEYNSSRLIFKMYFYFFSCISSRRHIEGLDLLKEGCQLDPDVLCLMDGLGLF